MMRIVLFLATNIAVLIVASITLSLLGVEHYLSGTGLNLSSLLAFCAVFGFAQASSLHEGSYLLQVCS
jgi:heat shock protein HtpX